MNTNLINYSNKRGKRAGVEVNLIVFKFIIYLSNLFMFIY